MVKLELGELINSLRVSVHQKIGNMMFGGFNGGPVKLIKFSGKELSILGKMEQSIRQQLVLLRTKIR